MKLYYTAWAVFGIFIITALTLSAQPGYENDKGDKKGPPNGKKGPPPFKLGKVLPPFVRDELELTDLQRRQIADLEKDVLAKLKRILTKDQQRQIEQMAGKGPKGPEAGNGKDKGRKGPRNPGDAPERPRIEKEPPSANLVKNPVFARAGESARVPEHYTLQGDVEWTKAAGAFEFGHRGIAFHSGNDLDGDGSRSGAVYQDVTEFTPGRGKWFRFSFRGLAENGFSVEKDALSMNVDFFGASGALDGVARNLYSQIEKDRRELAVNGPHQKDGGAIWRTYALDFMLPFAEIDRVRLRVGFRNGAAMQSQRSQFYVSEFSLVPLADPAQRPTVVRGPTGSPVAPADLIPLGGRWYYLPENVGDKTKPARLVIDHRNVDRLFYLDHQLSNPFSENVSAWLLKGYLDREGNLVSQDRFVADNVVIRFEDDRTMVIQSKNLPNHPTGIFPAPAGSGDRNPNYIQEQALTFYLPLEPRRNPNALVMDETNSNRALPMGPIGIAINGVVFFNPFDAGIQDATDFMDRCCGHPNPGNEYHYHKYPVCVKSPFVDEGNDHSPLIGFAFDGFPIYGPYETAGIMAKDAKENALNGFNLHHDEVRGWHYHVTPGRFPYVLGGYWGEIDVRNRKGKKNGPPKG